MAEDKDFEKEGKKSANSVAPSSSAKNSATTSQKQHSDAKNNASENQKTSKLEDNKSDKNVKQNTEIQFAETDEELVKTPTPKQTEKKAEGKNKTEKPKIDRKKLERIKRELFADDELSLEEMNKSIESSQAEGSAPLQQHGQAISRSERIKQKNEQLFQDVYRYNRQKTKDLAMVKRESLNIVLIVILFLLLSVVITLGVYLYLQTITAYDEDYIRVSVSMTNKDIFYDTEVTGDKIPKDVSPGDRFDLKIVARNSNSIAGDFDSAAWTKIFVRFKITLIVDGVNYDNFVYIEPNADVWQRYNKEIEDQYPTSEVDPSPVVKADDGYYYCRTILAPNEEVTVIDWLRFSEVYITEVVGGNDAVLKVTIEALEAIPSIIENREIWANAPHNWVLFMTDENNFDYSDMPAYSPNNTVNVWWIIAFMLVAVILTISIVYFATRKKKDKKKMADINRTINRKPK